MSNTINASKVVIHTPELPTFDPDMGDSIPFSKLLMVSYSEEDLAVAVSSQDLLSGTTLEEFSSVVLLYVSDQLSRPVWLITSRVRNKDVLFIRYALFALLRMRFPRESLWQIGKPFGKDHSTVLNGLRNHNQLLDAKDRKYTQILDVIVERFNCGEIFNFRYVTGNERSHLPKKFLEQVSQKRDLKTNAMQSNEFIDNLFWPAVKELFGISHKDLNNLHTDHCERLTLFLTGILVDLYPKLSNDILERRLRKKAHLKGRSVLFFKKKHSALLRVDATYQEDFGKLKEKTQDLKKPVVAS